MNVGLYQSASSLTALERWQDVVTQNITNSQVTGYKRRVTEFSGAEARQFGAELDRSQAAHGVGRSIFPYVTHSIDFTPGENMVTRGALDLVIQGPGFFEVENLDGEIFYSRAGHFQMTPDRRIVNSQGFELLNSDGNPFDLLPQGGEIIIDQSGMLSQGGVPLGQVAVVNFDAPERLISLSGGIFAAPEGLEAIPVENAVVVQGSVEGANVKPLREMVDLVNIARAYEANQKIVQTSDEIMKKTLETLG